MTAPSHGRPGYHLLEGAIDSVVDAMASFGVQPNTLTWASLVPAAAAAVATADGAFLLAVVFMAIGGLCDLLDGPLARKTEQASVFGALLDSSLDRVADAAPFLGLVVFYAAHPIASLVPALAIVGGFAVSYVRARAEGLNIILPWLWMRRTERLIITGVGLLLGFVPIPGSPVAAPVTLAFIAAVGILSFAAAVHALRAAANIVRVDVASRDVKATKQ